MTTTPAPYQLITGKWLVDGRGGRPVERGAVLLEGSKIRAVGAVNEVAAPEGAPVEVHDFPEATILPGLVDVHTHLNYPGDGTHTDDVMAEEDDILLMQSIVNARSYLAKGVTTIRDNGAKNYTTLSLKKGIARGLATGPRLSICVNPLTITGGHMWQMGAEADGVDEVVKGVRRLVKLGADYIKVAVTGGTTKTSDRNRAAYNLDELKAIVDEAHKFGRLVAGHAHASAGIVNCLDSGIDMIIHCSWNDADGGSTTDGLMWWSALPRRGRGSTLRWTKSSGRHGRSCSRRRTPWGSTLRSVRFWTGGGRGWKVGWDRSMRWSKAGLGSSLARIAGGGRCPSAACTRRWTCWCRAGLLRCRLWCRRRRTLRTRWGCSTSWAPWKWARRGMWRCSTESRTMM